MNLEQQGFNHIIKRNGIRVDFDAKNIIAAISKAANSVHQEKNIDVISITNEIITLLSQQFTNSNPPTVEQISDVVEKTLIKNNYADIAKTYILYREKRREERQAKESILDGLSVGNKKITLNAIKVLKERYLLKNSEGKIIETPEQLFWRVANNIALAELAYTPSADVKAMAAEFYKILANFDFLPNSPTLMNAGTPLQQLSACFVLPVDDSMESIFKTLLHAALIHKSGGGTGFSFSRLRPKNSVVQSTQGVASGPVSFLKVYNAATEVVKQGGKRRGANMGILRVDHPDIIEFINCKEKNDDITNFNLSVGITEKFMQAVIHDQTYELIEPHTKNVANTISARMVFDILVSAAWRNGDPGIVFLDRINADNPTPQFGEIESTNPCGEQPLLPYESCNLGSINLGNFVTENKTIDLARLKSVIHTSVRFLDNVIDLCHFPLSEIKELVSQNRKIGLGMMGWADMLFQLEIAYNSEEGLAKAEEVARFIKTEADSASEQLAHERGPFPAWKESVYHKETAHFKGTHRLLRNATRTTLAPTGTISMIADCSSGIEPLFALAYVKRVMDGKELFYLDKIFKKELERHGLYDPALIECVTTHGSVQSIENIPQAMKRIFVVSHDISPEFHVRMQAAFQKYTDNAVSKTVNFPSSATIEDVRNVYLLAHKTGCKGITIYRDGSKDQQVLNLTTTRKKKTPLGKSCPECASPLEISEGCCKCHACGYSACTV